ETSPHPVTSHSATNSRCSLAQGALSTGGGGDVQYCRENAEEAGGGAATAPCPSASGVNGNDDDVGSVAIDPWDTLARTMTSTGLWHRQDLPPALSSAFGIEQKANRPNRLGGIFGFGFGRSGGGGGGGGDGGGRILRGAALVAVLLLAARRRRGRGRGRKGDRKVLRDVDAANHQNTKNINNKNKITEVEESSRVGDVGEGGDVNGAPPDGGSATARNDGYLFGGDGDA
ncbi:hypothetical protein VaNZ11_002606, partial [Volvox africanus]